MTFTDADITALSGQNIYIYKGEKSEITKVTLFTQVADEEPTATTSLWTGTTELGEWANFESLRYGNKGELANAKVGDQIRVTFTNATEGWLPYVCDAATYSEFTDGYFDGEASVDAQTISFTIADATVLESIQEKGVVVKGKLVTLTKIELLTFASGYDAVAVSIGEKEIDTFSSAKKLSFTGSGLTAYYASEAADGKVTLTSTETTWDYQGYIVRGAEGTYTIPVTEDATYPSSNYLKANVGETELEASNTDEYRYIFAKHGD